jgi:long-subunit fatty acid transport protein
MRNTNISTPIRLTNFKLTGAYNLKKGNFIGLSINYDSWNRQVSQPNRFYADFGYLKTFRLENLNNSQSIGLGISNSNFTFLRERSTQFFNNGNSKIRQQGEIGISYKLASDQKNKYDLTIIKILAQAYYQNIWRYDFDNIYGGGLELVLSDILALRGGYYYKTLSEANSFSVLEASDNWTYGVGLLAPLDKITKVPVRIAFDIAHFPQLQIYNGIELGPTTQINLQLSYVLPD